MEENSCHLEKTEESYLLIKKNVKSKLNQVFTTETVQKQNLFLSKNNFDYSLLDFKRI